MRPLSHRLVAFNRRFGRPIRVAASADIPPDETAQFVLKVREETTELIDAINLGDVAGVADGIGDAIYVMAGIAVQYGLDVDRIIDIVHKSNMTKDQSASGDAVKGDSYKHPDLRDAISSGYLDLGDAWGIV